MGPRSGRYVNTPRERSLTRRGCSLTGRSSVFQSTGVYANAPLETHRQVLTKAGFHKGPPNPWEGRPTEENNQAWDDLMKGKKPIRGSFAKTDVFCSSHINILLSGHDCNLRGRERKVANGRQCCCQRRRRHRRGPVPCPDFGIPPNPLSCKSCRRSLSLKTALSILPWTKSWY